MHRKRLRRARRHHDLYLPSPLPCLQQLALAQARVAHNEHVDVAAQGHVILAAWNCRARGKGAGRFGHHCLPLTALAWLPSGSLKAFQLAQ